MTEVERRSFVHEKQEREKEIKKIKPSILQYLNKLVEITVKVPLRRMTMKD